MRKKSFFSAKSFISILLFFAFLYSKELIMEVPHSKQAQSYSCGQNSFRMLMGYFGEKLPLAKIFLWTGFQGTTHETYEKIVGDHFKKFRFSYVPKEIDSVLGELSAFRPVMAGVSAGELSYLDYRSQSGHFIVIVGFNTEEQIFYLRDPNTASLQKISYQSVQKAWEGDSFKLFTLIPQSKFAPHVMQKAPVIKKEKPSNEPSLGALIPTLYLNVLNTGTEIEENGLKGVSYLWQSPQWTLRWQGLYVGQLCYETRPMLEDSYYMGGSLAASVGGGSFLFEHADDISPGAFRRFRDKTLGVGNFTTIKRISYFDSPKFVLGASGSYGEVESEPFETVRFSKNLHGGLTLRRGISQRWGNVQFDGGVSYLLTEVKTKSDWLLLPSGSVRLGPLFGSYQEVYEEKGLVKHLSAYSFGYRLNLPPLSVSGSLRHLFSTLGFLGVFRSYGLYGKQRLYLNESREEREYFKLQLPMNLFLAELIAGFENSRTTLKVKEVATTKRETTLGAKMIFNWFHPYVQFQGGYSYTWKEGNYPNTHNIELGIYTSLR